MTVAELIVALKALPQDAPVVVGGDYGIYVPVAELRTARFDAEERPLHLCTADTPGAVPVVLL
jgi:hypothetical protein